MRRSILCNITALGVSIFLLATPSRAQTQPETQQPALNPAMQQDLKAGLQYPLPQDFMDRAAQTLQALQAANIRPPDSTRLTLRQTIAQIASTPGVPEILNAHGFTPESFTMGMTAFGMTLAATNGQPVPPGLPAANPANISLFHAHPDQVTALMQAMGTPPSQN
ncbi:hypothetical protein [Asaia astilbis]|uniref:hypothetical protein n=1 Tax=Asaia astilbis TaxID=610244 RepID=UPI00046E5855|nr:hypothetical protein [Asaia astilbis]